MTKRRINRVTVQNFRGIAEADIKVDGWTLGIGGERNGQDVPDRGAGRARRAGMGR